MDFIDTAMALIARLPKLMKTTEANGKVAEKRQVRCAPSDAF